MRPMNAIEPCASPVTSITDQLSKRKTAWKPKDLMILLSLSKSALYRAIDEGKLPAAKLGGSLRIDPAAALAWWEKSKTI